MLTDSQPRTCSLSINDVQMPGWTETYNFVPPPNYFSTLNAPALMMAGQPLSLTVNSSSTTFESVAASTTGWRAGLVRPDTSTVDLGLMADWAVVANYVYKWNMTVPGSYLMQVRCCAAFTAYTVHTHMTELSRCAR
jgi:hypothetical protein